MTSVCGSYKVTRAIEFILPPIVHLYWITVYYPDRYHTSVSRWIRLQLNSPINIKDILYFCKCVKTIVFFLLSLYTNTYIQRAYISCRNHLGDISFATYVENFIEVQEQRGGVKKITFHVAKITESTWFLVQNYPISCLFIARNLDANIIWFYYPPRRIRKLTRLSMYQRFVLSEQ